MATIRLTISVPDLLTEHFKQHDFNPFEDSCVSKSQVVRYDIDTDYGTKLIQLLMEEVKYQKVRNEKLEKLHRKMD